LLLDLLVSVSLKHQLDGSVALYKLANKAAALSPMDAAPPSPTPQVENWFLIQPNLSLFMPKAL
jgi:hypothetical protein